MEFLILSTLQFDMTFPTSNRFLEKYMKLLENDVAVMQYAQFLIDLALVDIRMLQYTPSVLTASAIIFAYKSKAKMSQQTTSAEKVAESFATKLLGFREGDLSLCQKELYFLQLGSLKSSLQAVRKKYSSNRYTSIH